MLTYPYEIEMPSNIETSLNKPRVEKKKGYVINIKGAKAALKSNELGFSIKSSRWNNKP